MAQQEKIAQCGWVINWLEQVRQLQETAIAANPDGANLRQRFLTLQQQAQQQTFVALLPFLLGERGLHGEEDLAGGVGAHGLDDGGGTGHPTLLLGGRRRLLVLGLLLGRFLLRLLGF